MRWKSPKLVVSFENCSIGMWQYDNITFTRLRDFKSFRCVPHRAYLIKNNLIILPQVSKKFQIYNHDGRMGRAISADGGGIIDLAYNNGSVITGGVEKKLRIWDLSTGKCVISL